MQSRDVHPNTHYGALNNAMKFAIDYALGNTTLSGFPYTVRFFGILCGLFYFAPKGSV